MSDLKDPRVLFAAERTLLAWNRSSLALIAFGFVIERSGLLMGILAPDRADSLSKIVTFWVGLAFIFVGAGAAVYSSIQYSKVLKTLNPSEFPPGYEAKWGIFINLVIALLGVALVVALILGQ